MLVALPATHSLRHELLHGLYGYIGLLKQQQHITHQLHTEHFSKTKLCGEMLTSCNESVPQLADPVHRRPLSVQARREHNRLPIEHVDSTQSLDVM